VQYALKERCLTIQTAWLNIKLIASALKKAFGAMEDRSVESLLSNVRS